MKTTAQKVLTELERRNLEPKLEGENKRRFNSPLRSGANSHSFVVTWSPDGEHGAYYDHRSEEGGSLYDLADLLGIERPKVNRPKNGSKRYYTGLADYAAAHGVLEEVFTAAGWQETIYQNRPALTFNTSSGVRWRFLDDQKPHYKSISGYKRCWYGLRRAVDMIGPDKPLVICNGEASTVVAQSYNIAACCVTAGEKPAIPDDLLSELKQVYSGPILIALDCDDKGRKAAASLVAQVGGIAIDLGLGNSGEDLADFCKLHGNRAAEQLEKCKQLEISKAGPEKSRRLKSGDFIATLTSLGYEFRLNASDDSIEVNGAPVTDPLRATIRTQMRDLGFNRYLAAIEDAYIAHGLKNQYHPVKEYLESIPYTRPGVGPFAIDRLAAKFNDIDGIFHVWLKRWMVGAIAKALDGHQNIMLVLDGAQDIGKSYFVGWLGSGIDRYYGGLGKYHVEAPINTEDKDAWIRLINKWIWEVGELGATIRKADREALKNFITTQTVTVRRSFGRYDTIKPAMASLIGTINNEAGFLNDPTGNRRFLVCELTKIDWSYAELDIDEIWAEAYWLYRNGEPWRLTPEEKAKQRQINARYKVELPVEELLLELYDIDRDSDIFYPTMEILRHLEDHGLKGNQKTNLMELAAVCKELGILQKRRGTNNIRGYCGLVKKSISLDEND